MVTISQRQQHLLYLLLQKEDLQSSAMHQLLVETGEDSSLITIKRELSEMVSQKTVIRIGAGRSAKYRLSPTGRLFCDIDARAYCSIDPDKRFGHKMYNFEIVSAIPRNIFTTDELDALTRSTAVYDTLSHGLSPTLQKKELERLIIELAWKSSKIEGNTYTLLDTEKLILENKEAKGHDKNEALMILNHKDAFIFIRENATVFTTLTRANLEKVHAILTKNLGVSGGLRRKPVGVTGSLYRPLDTLHQIIEAVNVLAESVARADTPYAKALVVLAGISYIQPFEDGNKRTSRLMANALLLAYGCAPLSYRSVDEAAYREAVLVFYELNSIVPLKKIFMEQYDFAARNYAVK